MVIFRKKIAMVVLVAGFLILLWYTRRIVLLMFIAAVLAAGIAPAVRRVQVWFRMHTRWRVPRVVAVLLVYFPFLGGAVLVSALGLPYVIAELQELGKVLPRLIDEQLLDPLRRFLPVDEIQKALFAAAGEAPLFGYLVGAVTLVTSIVVILALIVYMLMDAERLRNLFLLYFPPDERAQKRRLIRRVSRRMSSWLAGQMILGLMVGTATFIGLVLLGVPYALPLAIFAAFGELIPIVGPIVSAVPALAIALIEGPWQFWAVLALFIVIQQVENYVLVPRVMGKKVSVSPLAVFVAFLIGATLLGIVGAIIAVPAVAIVQVLFEEMFVTRRERRLDSARPGTLKREEVS
jgi:predicted PurR-regulated permease PerM